MYFSVASRRRYAETSRVTGKGAGGRVYGWLLLMALLAGQVQSQCRNSPPACELSFSPSENLLLGESFNITCTIPSDECTAGCYGIRYLYTAFLGSPRSTEILDFEERFPFLTTTSSPDDSGGCSNTLSSNFEAAQLQDQYLQRVNNAEWLGLTVLISDPDKEAFSETLTTTVQIQLPSILQENIQSKVTQPLDVIIKILALSNSQQFEGSFRGKTIVRWLHANSLDSDGTYFGREYLVNGITSDGSEGELARTTANSVELTLTSEQTAQDLTLTASNRLGTSENGTTTFQIPWPEPSSSLDKVSDDNWRMVVNFTEPVTDLMIEEDSPVTSVVLSNLEIIEEAMDNGQVNSVLTFTANLVDGQNYRMRLNLQNPATTQEITTEKGLNNNSPFITTSKEGMVNSGIRKA